jgi:hypothetical protein
LSADRPRSPLVEQILSGASHELQILAAEGLLPLPPDEVLALQVRLARHSDALIASRAMDSIRALDARRVAEFVAQDADFEGLAFFAAEIRHPVVIEAILRRRDVPRPLLMALARDLPPDLQEVLLLRQDAIVEEPGILETLEENPRLSAYSQRRITEFREHLLPKAAPPAAAAAPAADAPAAADELEQALAIARQLPAEGEIDEVTGLSEGQIRSLPLPARLRLSRGASRSLRAILVRDHHPTVALSVLINNAVSDQEIESIARNRAIAEELLDYIGRHREWGHKYAIVLSLVGNPRTPIATAVRLVSQLAVRDLRNLSRDRNVADAVRTTAMRLYRIKAH